jgi:hypothetical protein
MQIILHFVRGFVKGHAEFSACEEDLVAPGVRGLAPSINLPFSCFHEASGQGFGLPELLCYR